MDIFVSVLLLALGVALIVKGGDLFVTSSVAIAVHARIPRVVIGGTLVSLATTAPEFTVSVVASVRGNPGLAVGNAVGSAICNVGLIVGILCILRPLPVSREDFCFPARTMVVAGVLLAALTVSLQLSRLDGAILLAAAATYLGWDYARRRRRRDGAAMPTAEGTPIGGIPIGKAVAWFAVGAILVLAGSRLLTDNAVVLATAVGVPSMIVGLTVVALGTSLPELVTAITAARKGVPELSLGNVIGANIMNITLIPGLSSAIHPLTLSRRTQIYNFPAMLAAFILLLILARTGHKLTRHEGWVFIVFYVLYIGGLVVVEAV